MPLQVVFPDATVQQMNDLAAQRSVPANDIRTAITLSAQSLTRSAQGRVVQVEKNAPNTKIQFNATVNGNQIVISNLAWVA